MNDYARGILYAVIAALSASLVGIFAKLGMKDVPPLLATAMRSIVMMLFCVIIAAGAGMGSKLHQLGGRAIWMIVLSGVAGATSWMFGFLAYDKIGIAKTSPIDKLSVPLAVVLAVIFLQERPTPVNWAGIGLITIGAYLAAQK